MILNSKNAFQIFLIRLENIYWESSVDLLLGPGIQRGGKPDFCSQESYSTARDKQTFTTECDKCFYSATQKVLEHNTKNLGVAVV